jgi:hypothetical protein
VLTRAKRFLARFLDPIGPLGAILSPSIVFKPRQGIPLSVPPALRGQAPTTTVDIEKHLQISRVLTADAEVPSSRVRVISAFVEEHFQPIYDIPIGSTDLAAIAKAAQHPTIIGWKVTQHARKEAQAKAPMSKEEFVEHVQSLHFPEMSDEAYNQYLDFVKGNDPCIVDGNVLRGTPTFDSDGRMTHDGVIRGGTQIRGGKRDYREKTKGYAHVDQGWWKNHIAALAEESSRPVRNVKRMLEAVKGESLPMWSPVGINPRKDRQSGV